MNENDVQVGAMTSIPRYLEDKFSTIKWSASFPHSTQQSDTKHDKLSGDMLAKFDLSAFVLIEFKCRKGNSIKIKKNQINSTNKFNTEPCIYSRIAYNIHDNFISDDMQLGFERATTCLEEITALTGYDFSIREKNNELFEENKDQSMRSFIDKLIESKERHEPSALMKLLLSSCHADEIDNFSLWIVSQKKLHTLSSEKTRSLLSILKSDLYQNEKNEIRATMKDIETYKENLKEIDECNKKQGDTTLNLCKIINNLIEDLEFKIYNNIINLINNLENIECENVIDLESIHPK